VLDELPSEALPTAPGETEIPEAVTDEPENAAESPEPAAPSDSVLREPPPEGTTPSPTEDPAVAAEARLVEARAALEEGRYRDATRLATESHSIRRSLSARKLIAIIACHRGDLAAAKEGVERLPKATAARVVKECARKGVTLSPSVPKSGGASSDASEPRESAPTPASAETPDETTTKGEADPS
jgi:hypothetical protein